MEKLGFRGKLNEKPSDENDSNNNNNKPNDRRSV